MEYQGCFLGTMFSCVGEWNIGCNLGTMFSCAGEWNIWGVSWELCSVVQVSGISGVFPGNYVQLCR